MRKAERDGDIAAWARSPDDREMSVASIYLSITSRVTAIQMKGGLDREAG